MAVTSFKRSLYTSNPDKYISFLAGNTAYNPTSFESIATTTLGSDTSSITMSSIPSTYASIQFRILMRNTGGGGCDLNLRANSDTGNNYSYHYL